MQRSLWHDREWLLGAAALCGFSAVFVTAVLLTRLPGAQPLSAWWTMATAVVVGGLAAACLELFERRTSISEIGRVMGSIAGSGVMSLAVLATARQAGPLQLAFACVLSLLFASTLIVWAIRSNAEMAARHTSIVEPDESTVDPSKNAAASDEALRDHIDQTIKRYIIDGKDHLEACVRVRFQAGQQTAIVHLPIQPPMTLEPDVECEPIDDADLRITVDPVQPYGVRLVCRRGAPWTEAAETVVAVLATADSAVNAAA